MLRPWLPQSYTAVIVARSTKPIPPPCRRKPVRIKVPNVLYSLNFLIGFLYGIIKGSIIGVIKGDTRALDYSSHS